MARRGIKNASQTNEFPGRWQSGQSQQAVNLPPSGYGGSNPPLPTNLSALNERAVRLAALSVWRQARGTEWGRFKGWRTGRERRDEHVGGSNSVVESQPSKLLVAGSIPSPAPPFARAGRRTVAADWVGRSAHEANGAKADVAQLAERVLGKDEVTSSILVIGSNLPRAC